MSRHPRLERTTTSCGECRRRKQRCNQGKPCSNCARRFPQPACEYRSTARRQISPAQFGQQGASGPPFSPAYVEDATFQQPAAFDPFHSPKHLPRQPPQWSGNTFQTNCDIIRWSGITLLTQLPPLTPPEPQWNLPWPLPTGAPTSFGSPSSGVRGSTIHSVDVGIHMLETPALMHDPFAGEEWQLNGEIDSDSWFSLPNGQLSPEASPWPDIGGSFSGSPSLPSTTQAQQAPDLLSIYTRTLAPFSAALDGDPESSHPYIKYFVPWCLQNTLLNHTAMYTAACFLNESGQLSRETTLTLKRQAVDILNETLGTDGLSNDSVVVAHTQLILNEWYWGGGTDLGPHLRGLKRLVDLRGGFRSLGQHGLIAKMAITADLAITLSYETTTVLQCARQIAPLENTQVPLRLALNTPLVSTLPRFADCAEALRLNPATAAILDDMRFLISAVLSLSDEPSPNELQKINTTSAWIHSRTSALPDDGPRRPAPAARSATAPSIVVTNTEADWGTEPDSRSLSARRGSWHSVSSNHSAASSDQAYSDRSADDRLPNLAPPMPTHALAPSSPEPPDHIYQSVRLAAIIYSRAIMLRQSFSAVVEHSDFVHLWSTMWRVPLTTWKSVLGVFNWIVVAIAPAAMESARHGRFVKSMLANSLLQIGVDNWELARGIMEASGRLQAWLGADEKRQAGFDLNGSTS